MKVKIGMKVREKCKLNVRRLIGAFLQTVLTLMNYIMNAVLDNFQLYGRLEKRIPDLY